MGRVVLPPSYPRRTFPQKFRLLPRCTPSARCRGGSCVPTGFEPPLDPPPRRVQCHWIPARPRHGGCATKEAGSGPPEDVRDTRRALGVEHGRTGNERRVLPCPANCGASSPFPSPPRPDAKGEWSRRPRHHTTTHSSACTWSPKRFRRRVCTPMAVTKPISFSAGSPPSTPSKRAGPPNPTPVESGPPPRAP